MDYVLNSVTKQGSSNSMKRGKSQGKAQPNLELAKANSNKVQAQLFQKEVFRSKTPYNNYNDSQYFSGIEKISGTDKMEMNQNLETSSKNYSSHYKTSNLSMRKKRKNDNLNFNLNINYNYNLKSDSNFSHSQSIEGRNYYAMPKESIIEKMNVLQKENSDLDQEIINLQNQIENTNKENDTLRVQNREMLIALPDELIQEFENEIMSDENLNLHSIYQNIFGKGIDKEVGERKKEYHEMQEKYQLLQNDYQNLSGKTNKLKKTLSKYQKIVNSPQKLISVKRVNNESSSFSILNNNNNNSPNTKNFQNFQKSKFVSKDKDTTQIDFLNSDKIWELIKKIVTYNSFPDLLYTTLTSLKEIINYDKASFFIFDPSLISLMKDKRNEFTSMSPKSNKNLLKVNTPNERIQGSTFKGFIKDGNICNKYVLIYSESCSLQTTQNFLNLFELSSGNRDGLFLSGISKSKVIRQVLFGLQIERLKPKKELEKNFSFFTNHDENLFNFFMQIITLKSSVFVLQVSQNNQNNKMKYLLKMISTLVVERTPDAIYECVHKWMPYITDYNECSIIFFNPKDNEIFFAGDYLKTGNVLIMKFPKFQGITSKVLSNKQIYIGLKGNSEEGFVSEIDDVISVSKINNFAFVPLIDQNENCLGVLQLYNKKSKIEDNEKERLQPLIKLVGMVIMNMYEMLNTINITCAMRKDLNEINEIIKDNNITAIFGKRA